MTDSNSNNPNSVPLAHKALNNPWLFIPLLYLMQAMPVTAVQEVATIIYKDLGVENEPITRWTSLIALPWSLQMLLGPLVDLNSTKRNWTLTGHLVIGVALMIAAFSMRAPNAFEVTLVIFALCAVMSALTNIATDGFAILSMSKTQQAQFAGIMSTFYRLGRLFVSALLVLFAGLLMRMPPIEISGPMLSYKKGSESRMMDSAKLEVRSGVLATTEGWVLQPEIKIPPGSNQLRINRQGEVGVTRDKKDEVVGQIQLTESGPLQVSGPVSAMEPKSVWFMVILIGAVVYGALHLVVRATMPRIEQDVDRSVNLEESKKNVSRTGILLMLGVGGYFLINAVVRLVAHGLWAAFDGSVKAADATVVTGLQGWRLPDDNKVLGFSTRFDPIMVEVIQFGVCAAVVVLAINAFRNSIRGSEMGEALRSFIQQPGFGAIFFFILFYRFGEALVGKITPLFLKDAADKGGLAIANEQIGILSGGLGVIGIILGGIIGGFTVSKIGLRRSFWPLALAMHVPNLLYLWASLKTMPMQIVNAPGIGELNITLGGMLFVDQFGYGFGFAGYMVYLMWVAQRGRFVTSHYAIGTGMGALCIAIAGVLSGVLQKNFGYTGTFVAVIFMSVPGLLSLLFIPLDESHKEIKVEVE